jgi:simple sugar transport system permease protein
MLQLILEPRAAPLARMRWGAPVLALACTVLVSIPVLLALGLPPAETLRLFFIEPLRTTNGVSEWLLRASPLVLIALGESVAFRANVWNIGAEGMFTAGAIAAAWCALRFGATAPHASLLLGMACAGTLGGMAWAAIPAFLKTRANTNEILVTLMLNYVAALLLRYLVNGPMQDPGGLNYPQTALFEPAALFEPLVPGLRVNASIFITLAAAAATWIFCERSFLGFQMIVGGDAPTAARYAGYRPARLVWVGLLVSGATAGLAGMMEAAGPLAQLTPVISPGYGFTAIIVAFLGRLRPAGILLAGLLLSLLYLGGEAVQMALNVPASLARSFQGELLFFLLGADVLVVNRIRLRRH